MEFPWKEGDDWVVPEMGLVHVLHVFPSGSCEVSDAQGVRWILESKMFDHAEKLLCFER